MPYMAMNIARYIWHVDAVYGNEYSQIYMACICTCSYVASQLSSIAKQYSFGLQPFTGLDQFTEFIKEDVRTKLLIAWNVATIEKN